MESSRFTCVLDIEASLGECPVWSANEQVLYWVDIPFLVTPIPAALSMMLSTYNQRLGDRIADTIVIRNRSISEKEPS